ncbi:12798_t:CDS:2, partial [Gigaspora rosea]
SKYSINVISIFLTYLDENEKHKLTSNKYQVDLLCTHIFQKTLFEYADFLETYSNFEIRNVISSWYQYTQDISKPSLEIATLMAIQSMLFRRCKRIKKFYILVAEDSSSFPLIPISWYFSSELKECEFKFISSNSRHLPSSSEITNKSSNQKRFDIPISSISTFSIPNVPSSVSAVGSAVSDAANTAANTATNTAGKLLRQNTGPAIYLAGMSASFLTVAAILLCIDSCSSVRSTSKVNA